MSSLNQATIIGNLTRDPECRRTNDDRVIANISLATSENWKDANGQKQEKSEFHRVVFFNKLAEVVEKYVKKGDKILIIGKLQTRKWTDKDGNDRYTTEIVVDQRGSMQMLGGKSEKPAESNDDKPVDAFGDQSIPF